MTPGRRSLTPREIIGAKYRVIRLLGRGGSGRVYEAENTWTGRRVALKLLNPPDEVSCSDALPRFRQEAQAASRMHHPNIVDVLDMGIDPTLRRPFIVQEFLEGRDLATVMSVEGALSVETSRAVILPVMRALAYAHARGVIHRDVKPDNIFLARTPVGEVPKVIDFGIAKLTPRDSDAPCTRAGLVLGTPGYMSPEQIRGDGALDARSDVWSVGVVLYEMLSGESPFAATSTTLLLATILRDPPRPLRDAAPALARDLCAVVMKALAREPSDRWPTMDALADAFDAATRAEPAPPPSAPSRPYSSFAVMALAALVVSGTSYRGVTPQVVGAAEATAVPRARRAVAQRAVCARTPGAQGVVVRALPGWRLGLPVW